MHFKKLIALTLFISIKVCLPCHQYLQIKGFERDCAIADNYRDILEQFRLLGHSQEDVENINQYLALRFINAETWEQHLNSGKSDPRFIYLPAPLAWDMWLRGARYTKNNGTGLYEEFLNSNDTQWIFEVLHSRSTNARLLDGIGLPEDQRSPYVGRIISEGEFLTHRFEIERIKMKQISKRAKELKISIKDLGKGSEGFDGKPVTKIISIRERSSFGGRNHMVFKKYFIYGENKDNLKNIQYLGRKIKKQLNEISQGSRSAIDFIAEIQRHFVGIHPFGDGNGRVSRYLQDIFTQEWGLPYIPGGYLQNDILSFLQDYKNETREKLEKVNRFLFECLEQYRTNNINQRCKIIRSK